MSKLPKIGAIDPWRVALDTEIVRRGGLAVVLEQELRPKRGQRHWLSWEGFLVILMLTVRSQSFTFEEMAACYWRLPEAARRAFGEPHARSKVRPGRTGGSDDTVLNHLHVKWDLFRQYFDSSPVTRAFLEPDDRSRLNERRAVLLDRHASGLLPPLFHDAHVQDGTAVDGFRNRFLGGCPHQRLGHRTPTKSDPREKVFGFCLVCIGGASIDDEYLVPGVVRHHELVPANESEGEVTLRLYRRHVKTCSLRHVIGDRHISYSPYDFSTRLVALGARPVHDLHVHLQKQRGIFQRFLVIDCWLWHPDLPTPFWKLPNAPKYRKAGRWRSCYAAHLLADPTLDHPAALVGCPGRAYGPSHPATLNCPGTRARGDQVVDKAPIVERCIDSEVCAQPQGVDLPLVDDRGEPTDFGRGYQVYPRLSPEWVAIYGRLRALIENVFSSLTTRKGANVAQNTHSIWGLPGVALWAATAVAIHNHQRLWRVLKKPSKRTRLHPDDLEALTTSILFADRDVLSEHYERLFPGAVRP
ncbi:hypothetical protein [Nocardioides halotolerans]|uniref:hypothetical protein n=1 Tax=Nocardioides halotolerans TaxID=433660 RepID=UPI0004903352|nr:hypothetical protein [Nocardioides halotolerans]